MPELLLVALPDRLFELLEQFQAGIGNADLHDAAVVGHPLAADEVPLVEAVEHPRDVRGVRDQPRRQDERRQRARMLGLEQPEGVVLLGGQVVAGEQLVLVHSQLVVGPPQAEIRLLLRRVEMAARGAGMDA